MTISICGSMKFIDEMKKWKKDLEAKGFKVYVPEAAENDNASESGSNDKSTASKIENNYIKKHFDKIKLSEAILVLNYNKGDQKNYIGGNSLMEMGFAFTMNKDIILINPSPELSYKSEIDAMQPIIIKSVDDIFKYYKNLQTVFLSSESPLKLRATSLAFREYDMRYSVSGLKTRSGVSEQPSSIEETYSGAENRINDLKKKVGKDKYKYLISIESGNHILKVGHGYYGLSVCIIEDSKGNRVHSINTDLEFPKELTDLVPSEYPDLGVLVQEKFGIKEKDPYLHFTNNKISRDKLIFNTVVNTLSLLQF